MIDLYNASVKIACIVRDGRTFYHARIVTPNGDKHCGEAITPALALLRAAAHWDRYEP